MESTQVQVEQLRWLFTRIEGTCIFETNAAGIISYYGRDAEAVFGYSSDEVVGKMHYAQLHDD